MLRKPGWGGLLTGILFRGASEADGPQDTPDERDLYCYSSRIKIDLFERSTGLFTSTSFNRDSVLYRYLLA